MRTVRIVLRTEVPEELADDVIARFRRAAAPRLRVDLLRGRTMLNARTIEWNDDGSGTQVAAKKVL